MDEQRKMIDLLDQIPQPGFLIRDDRIFRINQAAGALCLLPGQAFSPLLQTGAEEFAAFRGGQLSLTLSIADRPHPATLIRMDEGDLVLLDRQEEPEAYRALALAAMQLRKPLLEVFSGAEAMTSESDSPAAQKLNRGLMQVLRLVSNMSDIGRYTGFARKDLQDVDSLLRELTEKASGLIGDGASLSYEGPSAPLLAPVDREQLDRALWNILSNCLKFNDKGIRIRISLVRHGNMLHITVRDNGTGIAQDVRSTLFQRYLRQPSIEDYRYGLGLGLSMVRTVAANHGGTLLVCEEEGGGTRITLTLAISQEKDPVLRSPIIRPDYSGGFDHGRIELSESLDPRLYEKL